MKKLIPILSSILALAAAAGERPRVEARQIYRSFMPALPQTAAFARLGITTRCFLVSEDVIDDGYPSVWKGEGEYDFAAFDRQVEDILKVSPAAKLVCIIDLNSPRWLTRSGRWGAGLRRGCLPTMTRRPARPRLRPMRT